MPSFLTVTLMAYVVSVPLLDLGLGIDRGVLAGKSLVPADVCFALVTCALLVRPRARLQRTRWPLVTAAAAAVAAVAISVIRAPGDQMIEIARTAYSMLVLLVLAHVRLTDRERGRVLDAWIATAVVLAAASTVAWVSVAVLGLSATPLAAGGSMNLGPSIVRVRGPMPAQTFAVYLALGIALLAHRAAVRAPSAAGRGVTAIVLLVVASALTLSRAFAGVAVTLAMLAGQRRAVVPWLWRWRRWAAALATIVVVAMTTVTVWPVARVEREDGTGATIGLDPALNIYPMLHGAGVRMFLAEPLLGVGSGEFGRRWCAYTSADDRHRGGPLVRCDIPWRPHSIWIGAAAEGGIIALGAWVALFATVLVCLVRGSAGDASLPRVAVAAVAGLLLAGASFDALHVKFVWAFLGLALGATADERERRAGDGDSAATR